MAHRFTKEEAKFISDNVYGRSRKELTELVNKHFRGSLSVSQITAYTKNHKLNTGRTGRFEKGHEPFNKGLRKWYSGGEATQFKSGHTPQNHRPIGSERINVGGYTEVKVADPNKWRAKHVVIWEEHNGAVPKGSVVIFGDGNKLNLDIGNLLLVTRRQLARLNQNHLLQNDVELTKTGILIADVYSKCSELKKSTKSTHNKSLRPR